MADSIAYADLAGAIACSAGVLTVVTVVLMLHTWWPASTSPSPDRLAKLHSLLLIFIIVILVITATYLTGLAK